MDLEEQGTTEVLCQQQKTEAQAAKSFFTPPIASLWAHYTPQPNHPQPKSRRLVVIHLL
jgi:hypothetical protein